MWEVRPPGWEELLSFHVLVRLHGSPKPSSSLPNGCDARESSTSPPGSPPPAFAFNRVLERIRRIDSLLVSEEGAPPRRISPAFLTAADKSHLQWGELQAHRRILGLLYVHCQSGDVEPTPLGEIRQGFDEATDAFKATLFDSRCLVFGLPPLPASEAGAGAESGLLEYPAGDSAASLEADVSDFLRSLYWVLESKRLDRSWEGLEAPPFPQVPDETKYNLGLENRLSKNFRKRCLGRLRKQVGDFHLLTGLPGAALEVYGSSMEALKAANDWLWLAAAAEGWAVAAIAVKWGGDLGEGKRKASLSRVSTFSGKDLKTSADSPRASSGERHQRNGKPSNPLKAFAKGHARNKSSGGAISSEPGTPRSAASLPHSKSSPLGGFTGAQIAPQDIAEKFRLAQENYEKFSFAAGLEVECVMRAAAVPRLQGQLCEMERFLRENTGKFLDGGFTHFDHLYKAWLCLALTTVFGSVGLKRKAAFFRRLSALFRLHPTGPNPPPPSLQDYRQVYPVLYRALEGCGLKEHVRDVASGPGKGWTDIQVRSLHEVYLSAERAGYPDAAIRHLAYLLQGYLENLDRGFVESIASDLVRLCSAEGRELPFPLHAHLDIPAANLFLTPVPMSKVPRMLSFELIPLPPALAPTKVESAKSSVFIYDPYSRAAAAGTLTWVVGCIAGVAVSLVNMFPFELEVAHLTIQSEGAEFETQPVQLTLPPGPSAHPVTLRLLGTPMAPGDLAVTGYSCEVLGVRNVVRLRDIPWPLTQRPKGSRAKGPPKEEDAKALKVKVLPALPRLEVRSSLPAHEAGDALCGDDGVVVATAQLTVYTGQSFAHEITITNASAKRGILGVRLGVEQPSVCGGQPLVTVAESAEEREALGAPLEPKESRSLSFTVFGVDPLSVVEGQEAPGVAKEEAPVPTNLQGDLIPYSGRLMTVTFLFTYEGGEEGGQRYSRKASLALFVSVVPAVLIAGWRVLAGDRADSRYLALDVSNATEAEAELEYDEGRLFSVQPKDTCRLPIQVPCSAGSVDSRLGEKGRLVVEVEEAEREKRRVQAHLAAQLRIAWAVPALQLTGTVPIGTLLAEDRFLRQIVLPPLLVDVRLNGQGCHGQEERTVGIGEVVGLEFRLSPSEDSVAVPWKGDCSLRVFQDLQHTQTSAFSSASEGSPAAAAKGTPSLDRSDHAVFLGPLRRTFRVGGPEAPKEASLVFSFLLRHEGVYKVRPNFGLRREDGRGGAKASGDGEDVFLPLLSFNVVTKIS